jgi:hypothetical protein
MDSLPFAAQTSQIGDQGFLDPDLPETKPIVFPQRRRPIRTAQIKYRLAALANDVDMCWPMIVRVDHCAPRAITETVGIPSDTKT